MLDGPLNSAVSMFPRSLSAVTACLPWPDAAAQSDNEPRWLFGKSRVILLVSLAAIGLAGMQEGCEDRGFVRRGLLSGRFGRFLGIGRTRWLTQGSGLESSGSFPLTLYPERLTVISAARSALSVRSVFVEGTIATHGVGIVTPNGTSRTLELAG